jgi:malonate-semialdehyde dehydrogenase (acetylating)/methylmalonate-semialdehyde dehydrogenase
MNTLISHFVAGQPRAESNSRTGAVFNPSTGEEIARCAYGNRATVDESVQVAVEAGRRWGLMSLMARQAVIFRLRELVVAHRDSLAETIGREHGKTIIDAQGEIGRAIEGIEFACNAAHLSKGEYSSNVGGDIDVFSIRRPIGVVGCVTPFNFPVMVPAVMMTMAIAVGNSVVWKPSEKVPSAALDFARLWQQAGLPDGVLNVVQGDKSAVDAILEHPDIAGVSFVGSTRVGEYVYRKGTSHDKRVAAFTGGKNHMIVMPDADLEAAANAFVSAGFGSASQRCMAVSLLLPVGEETAERLRTLIAPKIRALKVGPYNDTGADFGAVISRESKLATEQAIVRCAQEGGDLVIDGRGIEVAGHRNGFYVGPSLFDRVTTSMQLYREEIFGPVRGIVRPTSLEEAIAITNRHEYGNGAVIFTRDGKSAHRFMMEVEAGMIGVNVPVPLPSAHFNFGGLRRSKFGDAHLYGPDAARFYTKLKTVSQRWPEPDKAARPVSLAFSPTS